MRKIAIIGGSGFVGSRLIALWQKSNEHQQFINIDKRQSPFFQKVTQITNVLDREALNEGLKGVDLVVLLAAEHRDDVSPKSLYYDVNVGGMKNVLTAMKKNAIKRLVFTSSVAVYGLNKDNPNENSPKDPFNDYGKSKWQAEQVLQQWCAENKDFNANVLRPTVIFGERNRGNVYNLLKQISGGKFMMVGKGNNKKSMAYVGNIVAFINFLIDHKTKPGYEPYNYIDKPDLTMNELVPLVSKVLKKHVPTTHIPYGLGMLGGYGFDALAKLSGKKLAISSVRVKKFCATTQFDATKVKQSGFQPEFSINEGLSRTLQYEFLQEKEEGHITFETE